MINFDGASHVFISTYAIVQKIFFQIKCLCERKHLILSEWVGAALLGKKLSHFASLPHLDEFLPSYSNI